MPADNSTSPPSLEKAWRSGPARAALLNDPGRDRIRTLPARRGLVLAYAALTLGAATGIALGQLWWLLPILLLEVIVIGSLNVATRGVVDLREQHLDERQREVALVAHRRAYKIALSVVFAALVTSALWADAVREVARPDRFLITLLYLASAALLMLPTSVVAWTERDA